MKDQGQVNVDLTKVEPYVGPLEFGPEVFAPLDEDWSSKIKEQPLRKAAFTHPSPTPAQIKAGNYAKRVVKWRGLNIAIENEKGSVRRGVKPNGDAWATTMANAYGYAKRSTGVDGDEVDIFLGPDLAAPDVYVVHQRKVGDWTNYDEDKCMVGFPSEEAAKAAFLANYDDPRFLGPVSTIPADEFVARVKATKGEPAMVRRSPAELLAEKHGGYDGLRFMMGGMVPEQRMQIVDGMAALDGVERGEILRRLGLGEGDLAPVGTAPEEPAPDPRDQAEDREDLADAMAQDPHSERSTSLIERLARHLGMRRSS